MESTPLISVIVPCFNQGEFLADALNSIQMQNYRNWECLIIDDGSTDNTKEISVNWCRRDDRFQYFSKENGGLSNARNFGLEKAKGSFIQFLDADDFIDPEKFQISIEYLKQDADVDVVISNFKMLEDDSGKFEDPYCKLKESYFTFVSVLYTWDEKFTIPIHCGLFRISFFLEFRFPVHLRAKEDWIMWILFFKSDKKASYLPVPLAFYRRHLRSMTMSENVLNDHLDALHYLRTYLSLEEYLELNKRFIIRYYKRSLHFKEKYLQVKNSRSFRIGILFQKIWNRGRELFPDIK